MELSFADAAGRIDFVLVRPSHPGNVGSAARALRVMGFRRLTLVSPRHADAPSQPEAIAFASGAEDILRSCRVVASLDEALADMTLAIAVSAETREFAPASQPPEAVARGCRSELVGHPGASIALVFGTERTGLSIDEALRCQALCSIPGADDYMSLNLAQAVQVLAYTLRRELIATPATVPGAARTAAPPPGAEPRALQYGEARASLAQVEELFAHLERSLVEIGFLDPRHPKKLMPRLRRLFGRTRLEIAEVDLLRGICTQIERFPERFR